MAIWLAIYAIALFALVLVVIGDVPAALFLIVVTEVIFLTLRPQPKFGGSTYRPPAPAQWQPAITTVRRAGTINSAWAIGTTTLVLTIAAPIPLVFLMIGGLHHQFWLVTLIVLAPFCAWLLTCP